MNWAEMQSQVGVPQGRNIHPVTGSTTQTMDISQTNKVPISSLTIGKFKDRQAMSSISATKTLDDSIFLHRPALDQLNLIKKTSIRPAELDQQTSPGLAKRFGAGSWATSGALLIATFRTHVRVQSLCKSTEIDIFTYYFSNNLKCRNLLQGCKFYWNLLQYHAESLDFSKRRLWMQKGD